MMFASGGGKNHTQNYKYLLEENHYGQEVLVVFRQYLLYIITMMLFTEKEGDILSLSSSNKPVGAVPRGWPGQTDRRGVVLFFSFCAVWYGGER